MGTGWGWIGSTWGHSPDPLRLGGQPVDKLWNNLRIDPIQSAGRTVTGIPFRTEVPDNGSRAR